MSSDKALQPYLECPDEQSAENLLAGLLFHEAEPLVRGVLARRLQGVACAQDREDVAGEIILDLLLRLRRNRIANGASPVESFRAYVKTAAHHACDGFFRRRYPQRHRLKNRLRYVLHADPRFAIWSDENGCMTCGWAAWAGQATGHWPASPLPSVTVDSSAPLELVLETVFDDVGGPIALDDVVGFLAAAWGVRDTQVPIESIAGQANPSADPAAALDNRRRLEHLWDGIVELPPPQRVALLLHLRDDRGGPVLALFPASGIASLPEIAAALEMPVEELAELWRRLPLSDAEIGPRLQLGRQQVINLRSAARQRLTRRNEWYGSGKPRAERGNIPRNSPSL